jgi:hypothetical protein
MSITQIIAIVEGEAGAGIDTASVIYGRRTIDQPGRDREGTCFAPTSRPLMTSM